jgi:hypothetical protein
MKTININNETYVLESDVKKQLSKQNIKPTKKQIVILNRGWVVVGNYSEKGDECTLTEASVIRVWGTTKGIGELAENGPLTNTKLDPCPNVHFHKMVMVARMDVNEDKWE